MTKPTRPTDNSRPQQAGNEPAKVGYAQTAKAHSIQEGNVRQSERPPEAKRSHQYQGAARQRPAGKKWRSNLKARGPRNPDHERRDGRQSKGSLARFLNLIIQAGLLPAEHPPSLGGRPIFFDPPPRKTDEASKGTTKSINRRSRNCHEEAKRDSSRRRTDVGYRKPPKAHQFRKGRSGNPRGRKRGEQNILSIFKRIALKRVKVNDGGTDQDDVICGGHHLAELQGRGAEEIRTRWATC